MPKLLTFRRATRGDIPELSHIRLSVRENVLSNPALITSQMYEDHLDRLGRTWVAETETRIVGFASGARDGSIWALFVDPPFEGRGAGRGLMEIVTRWLFSLGHRRLRLGTEPGSRADRFYAAQGWTRGQMLDAYEVEYTLER